MGEKSFIVYLDEHGRDRYRMFCLVNRGVVTLFCVQYEAFIQGAWHPVVRYDTAHNFPHRDLLHPDQSQDKTLYPGSTLAEVLTIGQEDIKRNWRAYRARYEKEMHL